MLSGKRAGETLQAGQQDQYLGHTENLALSSCAQTSATQSQTCGASKAHRLF